MVNYCYNQKKMKALLIVPRYTLTDKINYDYSFPLGLAYICAVIKKAGHEVDVLNTNHRNGTTEFLLKRALDSNKYGVVCTGHMGIGHTVVQKIIDFTKEHKTHPKVIIGGSIITTEPKLMFEDLKPDFGIIGEAEETIVELLDSLENKKDLTKVLGIIFENEGKLVFTGNRPAKENLDELPMPDYTAFEYEKQLENMSSNHSPYGLLDYPRVYPMLASRGCVYSCTFCYHCAGYRQRSMNNVVSEIKEAIKKYKINLIAFYDDLFSFNRERLFEFCKLIKPIKDSLNGNLYWTCQLTVNGMDDELLSTMKEAGCYAISYGFESYANEVLIGMRKPATPEKIDNVIKLCMKHKMTIQGNFIFGDVYETKETAKITLDYWKKEAKGQVYLGWVQPYPGSEIYDRCIREGIIKDRKDFIHNKIYMTNFYNITKGMKDEEVMQLKNDVLEARRKYTPYTVPIKMIKENKGFSDRYTLLVKCPFCKEKMQYKNFPIADKFVYTFWNSCKNCRMRIDIASPLYLLGVKHHDKVEGLRKIYLRLRRDFLKNKI